MHLFFCKILVALSLPMLLLLTLGLPATSVADDNESKEHSSVEVVETFSPPRVKQQANPSYPRRQMQIGGEGWVQLNYMVDPQGKPYEVTVVSSSNVPSFEREAVRAAEGWLYEPALLNGQPIDAGVSVFMTFELQGGRPGASSSFVGRYKRFLKYIEQGKLEKAAEKLADMRSRTRNLYEDAYLNLADFNYGQHTGASVLQLYKSIRSAGAMDKGRGFLPDAVLTMVLENKLKLELQLNKLGYARETGQLLKPRQLTPDLRTRVDAALAEIDRLQEAETPFGTNGLVSKGNLAFHVLLHNRFTLRDVQGDIAELRIHCERGYVGLIPRVDTEYKVKQGFGDCNLMLIGTPGSTYRLIQG